MKRYLEQLEDIPATETPRSLIVVRNAGFIEIADCVRVQMDGVSLPTFDAAQKDKTDFEAFHNHIHLTDYAAPQGDMKPLELLRFGLDIVDTWVKNLEESYPNDHFHIVLSFDEEDCVIRLYKLRNEEMPWIDAENVEDFTLEGVMVYQV